MSNEINGNEVTASVSDCTTNERNLVIRIDRRNEGASIEKVLKI
jgi:hypothetical protein